MENRPGSAFLALVVIVAIAAYLPDAFRSLWGF